MAEKKIPTQLPLNILTIGEVKNGDVKVYIKQNVYKQIEKYSHSDVKNEIGSFLFGYCQEELGKMHVIISNFVEAKYTDASTSTLTFTHETWEHIHSEHEKHFPELKMLGWHHTHPDFGIFLSSYDLFIQENFFNLTFQIAYVVDPIKNERGFFQWKNGKVEELGGYYVYDEIGETIKPLKNKSKVEKTSKKAREKLYIISIAVLLVLSGILFFQIQNLSEKIKINDMKTQSNEFLVIPTNSPKPIVNDAINYRKYFMKIIKESDSKETIEKVISLIDQGKLTVENKENTLKELRQKIKMISSWGEKKVLYLKSVIVSEGDSLVSICNKLNVDFYKNLYIIKLINGINNVNEISVGQLILIPSK
ncbi:MAG: metal-dependent protease of the PAD1/JAB1 superfamily [Bacillota bacterium]